MMRVHAHTKFCFLCVLTLLFHQCARCHESGHHHHHHDHDDRQISKMPPAGPANLSAPGSDADAAEHEQQFYILQLFQRYGHQDRLDFKGFQDLLLNLGLGEVRVVELDHDDLGHDHVAHLDLLEVQEGKHWHSAGHPHAHAKPHNHHHSRGDTNGSMCSPRPDVENDSGRRDGHDHDHGSDHDHDHHDHGSDHDHDHDHGSDHDHDNNHDHGSDHDHDHDHDYLHHHEQLKTQAQVVEHDPDQTHGRDQSHDHSPGPNDKPDPADPTHEHNDLHPGAAATETSSESRTHRHDHHRRKTPHPHNHHHALHPTDRGIQPRPTRASAVPGGSVQPSTTRTRKRLKARPRHRKPNAVEPTGGSDAEGGENGHQPGHDELAHSHGQARKGKREVPVDVTGPDDSAPSGHFDVMSEQHEECLNLTQLFHHYGLSPDSVISPAQFTYLCPALLYQIDSRVCIRHYHQVDVEEAQQLSGLVWLWSFIAITVISLLSLLGVVLVPILNQSCFKFLLTFLVALAVGTLSGDALLHLLPHSLAEHDHGEHDGAAGDVDWLSKFDGVWKGLTALAGIYLLFIIEHCIRMFKHYKDRRRGVCRSKRTSEDGTIGRKLSDHNLNRHSAAERIQLSHFDDSSHTDTQMTELQPPDCPGATPLAITVSEDGRKKAKKKGHGHSHHCHSEKDMQDAGITSIAWMVIMGDGMHNFSDGLAIGAAFSASVTGGISTSVAVFCHELPHELGDFAVLLKAGMTVKQAIVYNLLSALMAYFGMVIGTALGQYAHNVTSWIFAVTAGMFLYVALVDMLPEMLHGDSEDQKHCNLAHFVLQNLGMLCGFAIMLLIAIFEDRIVLNLGF